MLALCQKYNAAAFPEIKCCRLWHSILFHYQSFIKTTTSRQFSDYYISTISIQALLLLLADSLMRWATIPRVYTYPGESPEFLDSIDVHKDATKHMMSEKEAKLDILLSVVY